MKRKRIAWLLLTLSTLGGMLSVYQLLFSIWMTANPRYDSDAWHTRFYERLAITVLDGLIWVGSIVWLVRLAGKAEKTSIHQNDAQG
jgi:uncharacterized membrane protein